jgi:fatty-acyl-CoA synthase
VTGADFPRRVAGLLVDMPHPTPTRNALPLRFADFDTLTEALDYAALGATGCNFHDARGELTLALSYADLRRDAQDLALRFGALGLPRQARVALVAETDPDFVRLFFACQYAGLVPVPLPAAVHLGGRDAYVRQLRAMLASCEASVALAPGDFAEMLREAADETALVFCGTPQAFRGLPVAAAAAHPARPDELAYLQYTSGSTRFPRGVMITHRTVMQNLQGIVRHGLAIRDDDRFMSWLPFYHDMGLVGLVFSPLAAQRSVDYLGTRDFAMRPRQWLALMSRNRATIAFSPPFGYALVARRLRPSDIAQYDLSAWRIAGVGAETIRAETLEQFAAVLRGSGFREDAFLPCYGMAECSLAVSFASLAQPVDTDAVDAEVLASQRVARPATAHSRAVSRFVNCGAVLPGHQVEIRDAAGRRLPERRCGTIFVHGPSVMSGYFGDAGETARVLSADGWLNTGDVGYLADGQLFITGREKDLFIINGRNIWPQDLEFLAEQQPELRPEDTSAFAVPGADGADMAVLVMQCREQDPLRRMELVARLQGLIQAELGIACFIELVPPHTLPRTSSGKLSRSGARRDFLARNDLGALAPNRAALGID